MPKAERLIKGQFIIRSGGGMVDAISPYAVEAGKFNNTGSNPVLTTIWIETIYIRRKPAEVGFNTPNNNRLVIRAVNARGRD